MKHLALCWMLMVLTACAPGANGRDPAAAPLASPEVTLAGPIEEELLPGRYDFRVVEGWMVRFDTATGTYCTMENISATGHVWQKRAELEVEVPGARFCDEAVAR